MDKTILVLVVVMLLFVSSSIGVVAWGASTNWWSPEEPPAPSGTPQPPAPSVTPQAPAPWKSSYTRLANTDITGGDIPGGSPDVSTCENNCNKTPDCKSYMKRSGQCWLKNTTNNTYAWPGTDMYIKPQ